MTVRRNAVCYFFTLGKTLLEIRSYDRKFIQEVQRIFKENTGESEHSTHIILVEKEKSKIENPKTGIKTGNFFILKDTVQYDFGRLGKASINLRKKVSGVTIKVEYSLSFKPVNPYQTPAFLSKVSQKVAIFFDQILFPFIILFSKDLKVFHGSAVEINNKAIFFTGWGGSGKTTFSSYLMKEHVKNNAKFMADDLFLVSEKNQGIFNPIPINLYPYNFNEYPAQSLERTLDSPEEKRHWHERIKRYGQKGTYRKMRPHEMYSSEKISKRAPINHIFFCQKADVNSVKVINGVEKIDALFRNIIFHELKVLHYFNSSIQSIYLPEKNGPLVKLFIDLEKKMHRSAHSLTTRANTHLLLVPYSLKEQVLRKFFKSFFDTFKKV